MRFAWILFALFAVPACGEPEAGDPCEPGSGVIPILDGPLPPECRGPSGFPQQCALVCTGPAGCEGDPDFRWQVEPESIMREYCDCSGVSGSPVVDFGSLPTRRWRYYGRCEDPCQYVGPASLSREPTNPICNTCDGAQLVDGECVYPGGFPTGINCCDCDGVWIAEDGTCRAGSIDQMYSLRADFCCE